MPNPFSNTKMIPVLYNKTKKNQLKGIDDISTFLAEDD